MKSPSHRSLLAGFALAIALIGGVTWLHLDRQTRAQDAADWVAHTQEVRYVISDLFLDLQDVESGMRGFVLTGQPAFLESYHAAARQIEDEVRLVRSLTSTIPEQQKSIATLEPLIKRMVELAARSVKVRQEQGFEPAQALVASGQGLAAMEIVRAEIGKMDAAEVRLLKERNATTQKEEADVRTWTVIGACSSLALLALVFALLLRENRQRRKTQEIADRLAAIVRSSDDAIVGKDLNGIITSWNEGAEKIFGYTATEIVGTSGLRLIPPDRQQEEQDILKKIRGGDGVDHFETLRQTKDGRLLNVSITASPIKDAKGTIIGASKVARDITARKREEEELRRTGAQLNVAMQTMSAGAWDLNLTNLTATRTQLHDRIFGYETMLPDWTYQMFLEHVLPEDRPEVDRRFRAARAANSDWNFECRIRRTDGEVRWIFAAGIHVLDQEGKPVRLTGVVQDITARKLAEEEMLKKNAELEVFTNMVSHDLKSPLVTINTFLGYLEKDLDDRAALAKDLGYIHGAADKMGRLLDELLALARVGHMRSSFEEIPLQDIVREAQLLVAGQSTARGVEVEVTRDPVFLHGDRSRLVELFQNLLDNAVKFLGDQPAPRIEIGAEQEGNEVVLFVRDNGKGIALCDLPKLFGLFEKLDPHTPGSGIGLAMVRRIVEAHGGTIQAQSDGPGMGATFRFTLEKTQMKSP